MAIVPVSTDLITGGGVGWTVLLAAATAGCVVFAILSIWWRWSSLAVAIFGAAIVLGTFVESVQLKAPVAE